ncbi:sensor histidine kinase [Nitratireductor luteus]|uniref:sensor histidine kinase n=1 Tax=Nitratireductor luteus TaxID=2976980 RepID=UPI0022404BEC|nr:HAMP domain-containing sensor histidine kinase [Nitratireductor luteus]
MHPSVGEAAERARQSRLLGVLLAGPSLVAAGLLLVLPGHMDGAVSVAWAAMTLGLGLLFPFVLIATALRRLVEPAALVAGVAAAGSLAALAGGAATPMAGLCAALAIEAAWVGRSRPAAAAGMGAAGIAMIAGALFPWEATGTLSPAWGWLVIGVYGATLAARIPFSKAQAATEDGDGPLEIEELIGAAVFQMTLSGDIVHASDRTRQLLGVAPEIMLGSGLFDRLLVADRVIYLSALADLRDDCDRKSLRVRLRRAVGEAGEGAYRPFFLELVRRGDGETIAGVLYEDRLAAELEHAFVEARESAQAAALSKTKFLASVSHELRTPLNAIVGFSDVLANEMFGPFANEKQREYVGHIREAGDHLLSVVNAILDVSKIQSGTYALGSEPFEFDGAVQMAMRMNLQKAQEKGIELGADIADDVGTVDCDRRAVQQILINLLSNAVKFTPAGQVEVTARRLGNRLDFTVSDTGIGIAADDLDRLGTPFMQVQSDYTRHVEGTGLGLTLVKGLVGLLDGGMSIESTPGKGTSVTVSLPVGHQHQVEELGEGLGSVQGFWNSEWTDDALRKTA